MATIITGRRKPTKPKKQARAQKRKRDDVDVDKLAKAVVDLDTATPVNQFEDLPLSEPTKAGLKGCHFTTMTDIQSKAIALGLKGHDILGAAKTGSGKTLAFVIPVLENLYRSHCVGQDAGLGAMIISPTRELAIQIFDVLYKIGNRGHQFAAGLIIGGKSLQEEQQVLLRMNILVCTPGRVLQHLSETAAFNVDNLQMLVLDEADRILDMGFQRDVDAILEYLPSERQTLLFSATQTKRVSDLARLSLQDPEYIAVHEAATSATPSKLQQNYTITPLPTKLDTLWSFIQSSKKAKILVFLSSGKQVRYVYEIFRRMQPGIPLLHLHGRQKQTARHEITTKFTAAKHSCLFSTDVAARGLDFPSVDWVVQVDCPEDADTYIHRVGRTARYEREGRAVLFLDPSEEEGMLEQLTAKKVPIERINVRTKKQKSIRHQFQGLCFKDPALKHLGQRAFASYIRSVYVQKHKNTFNLEKYDMEEFAASLGLPGAPRIKFLKGDAEASKLKKNAVRRQISDSESDSEGGENHGSAERSLEEKKSIVRTRYDRMFERRNQDILSDRFTRMIASDDEDRSDAHDEQDQLLNGTSHERADDDDDDDLFKVKRRVAADASLSGDESDTDQAAAIEPGLESGQNGGETFVVDSNRRAKALKSKKKVAKIMGASSNKVVFDEETGEARPAHPFKDESSVGQNWKEKDEARRQFVEEESRNLKERDITDKEVARQKRQEKKDRRKEREREVDDVDMEERSARRTREKNGPNHDLPAEERPFELLDGLYDDSDPENRDDQNRDGRSEKKRRTDDSRPKKWFERDVPDQSNAAADPETLEDLEALARNVLS